MSTKFEKLVATHELIRRKADQIDREKKRIEDLSTTELEAILAEPDEPEATP